MSRDRRSAEELDRIRRAISEAGSVRGGARLAGVSWHYADLAAKSDPAIWTRNPDRPDPEPPVDPVEAVRLKLETARELARERELLFALAGEKSLRNSLEGLVRSVAPAFDPPPRWQPPHKVAAGASVETALLLWSDWHAYETVKRERVQGLNQYDAPTMARRLKRVVDKSLDIKRRMEQGGWSIPNAVIACNGDFVSGTIHEVERHSDAPNVIMAVYGAGMLLASAIRDVASEFRSVEVFCTSGNHGRLPDARRMQQKDPTRNWDTLIYLFAREALRDLPNVDVIIPDSYAVSYAIGSKNFLQYHGHDIKSWNSIPHYGIQRYARNINALKTRRNEAIDYFLISHFHADSKMPAGGAMTYVNGSLIGGTEFSVNGLGACDQPMQKLFFVSDPIGVNSEWAIMGEVEGEVYPDTYTPHPWECS